MNCSNKGTYISNLINERLTRLNTPSPTLRKKSKITEGNALSIISPLSNTIVTEQDFDFAMNVLEEISKNSVSLSESIAKYIGLNIVNGIDPKANINLDKYKISETCNDIITEAFQRVSTCQRVINNQEKLMKRFNVDKIITGNRYNPIAVIEELCELIDTYDIPNHVKFNIALENITYSLNKNNMGVKDNTILESVTEYFLERDEIIPDTTYAQYQEVLKNNEVLNASDSVSDLVRAVLSHNSDNFKDKVKSVVSKTADDYIEDYLLPMALSIETEATALKYIEEATVYIESEYCNTDDRSRLCYSIQQIPNYTSVSRDFVDIKTAENMDKDRFDRLVASDSIFSEEEPLNEDDNVFYFTEAAIRQEKEFNSLMVSFEKEDKTTKNIEKFFKALQKLDPRIVIRGFGKILKAIRNCILGVVIGVGATIMVITGCLVALVCWILMWSKIKSTDKNKLLARITEEIDELEKEKKSTTDPKKLKDIDIYMSKLKECECEIGKETKNESFIQSTDETVNHYLNIFNESEEYNDENLKKMINNFKSEQDKSRSKIKNFFVKLHTKSPESIIDQTPSLMGIARASILLGTAALGPIGLVTSAISGLVSWVIARNINDKEAQRLLKAIQSEEEIIKKKIDKTSDETKLKDLKEYLECLQKCEKKTADFLNNLSDDYYTTSSSDDDDMDDDFDFGDDDLGFDESTINEGFINTLDPLGEKWKNDFNSKTPDTLRYSDISSFTRSVLKYNKAIGLPYILETLMYGVPISADITVNILHKDAVYTIYMRSKVNTRRELMSPKIRSVHKLEFYPGNDVNTFKDIVNLISGDTVYNVIPNKKHIKIRFDDYRNTNRVILKKYPHVKYNKITTVMTIPNSTSVKESSKYGYIDESDITVEFVANMLEAAATEIDYADRHIDLNRIISFAGKHNILAEMSPIIKASYLQDGYGSFLSTVHDNSSDIRVRTAVTLEQGNLQNKDTYTGINKVAATCIANTALHEINQEIIQEKFNLNSIKLLMQNAKRKLKNLSTKQKSMWQSVDAAGSGLVRSVEKAMTSDRREAIIKGSIVPSFSKCIKSGMALAGAGVLFGPMPALIGAVGALGVSKALNAKERKLIYDEIDTELQVVDRQIEIAQNDGDMNQYRFLLNYKKKLTREHQRIKYGLKVAGRDIPSAVRPGK